jgi:ATPase subunit of ABC transporter with duplicated ATPase domains
MPPLVAAQRLGKAFGARSLFSGLSFGIEPDERIGLIGPNGAGKSTLLSILAQETPPDDGTVIFQGGVSVGLVPQIPSFAEGATVRSVVLEGALAHVSHGEEVAWEAELKTDEALAKLSLTTGGIGPDSLVTTLSGGRRSAWPSPASWSASPTSSSSTSRRTTSTSRASSGSRSFSRGPRSRR